MTATMKTPEQVIREEQAAASAHKRPLALQEALDAAGYVICRKGDPEAYRDLGFVVWASETPLPAGVAQFKRDGDRIGYVAVDESKIAKP